MQYLLLHYYVILRQNYVMIYLGFSNNYFDKIVVIVQGSFTKRYQKYMFQELSERLIWQLEHNIHLRKRKGNKERLLTCFTL